MIEWQIENPEPWVTERKPDHHNDGDRLTLSELVEEITVEESDSTTIVLKNVTLCVGVHVCGGYVGAMGYIAKRTIAVKLWWKEA